ncbi:unnamed protein product [Periconia digitata]|uniref:Uncharacterized protein n=1 Tax=Periconia digitata TaxID=1303443 RepID=A0A9W4U963_9PLEO|nr:unnamed protein product [Periconia digitata]
MHHIPFVYFMRRFFHLFRGYTLVFIIDLRVHFIIIIIIITTTPAQRCLYRDSRRSHSLDFTSPAAHVVHSTIFIAAPLGIIVPDIVKNSCCARRRSYFEFGWRVGLIVGPRVGPLIHRGDTSFIISREPARVRSKGCCERREVMGEKLGTRSAGVGDSWPRSAEVPAKLSHPLDYRTDPDIKRNGLHIHSSTSCGISHLSTHDVKHSNAFPAYDLLRKHTINLIGFVI